MSAEVAQTDAEQHTDVEEKAIEIIETATEEDTVLFNDRVQPLTVETVMGPYQGKSGFDYLKLEGPRGGEYMLVHREKASRGDEVKLRRRTGEYDDEHGFDPDPDYDVLTDDGVKRITHEVVERIEAPHRMAKSEFKQYIRDEVLPLEKEQEAEA
jgi:hypothetical protein